MVKEGEFAIERCSYNIKDKIDKKTGLQQSITNQVIFNVLKPDPRSKKARLNPTLVVQSPKKPVSRASSFETPNT